MSTEAMQARWSRPDLPADHGEGGAVLPLAVFLVLLVTMFVFLVYNTGYSLNTRVQAQNAADASALTGAIWAARGLNLISQNNRAATAVIAKVILMRAMDQAIDTAKLEVPQRQAEAAALIYAGQQTGNLLLVLQGQQLLADTLREDRILDVLRDGLPKDTVERMTADETGDLWAVMRSLEYFSAALAVEIPIVAQTRALQLGRYNTDSEGLALVLSPSWMAFPEFAASPTNNPNQLFPTGAGVGMPVVRGEFADFQPVLEDGRPPYQGPGRHGWNRPGPYSRGRGELMGFLAITLPLTGARNHFDHYTREEFARLFVEPGPKTGWPAPMLLSPEIRQPARAVHGPILRELGVWAVAYRRSVAPFWLRRFTNPTPADLAMATARAKVTNPASWDLWSPNWQAKLTHADWTFDRAADPLAVGPEQLSANLLLMLDSGQFDSYWSSAIGRSDSPWGASVTAGLVAPPDPRDLEAGRTVLTYLSQGGLAWDEVAGRSFNTH